VPPVSLLVADGKCPECGEPLPPVSVICIACGYHAGPRPGRETGYALAAEEPGPDVSRGRRNRRRKRPPADPGQEPFAPASRALKAAGIVWIVFGALLFLGPLVHLLCVGFQGGVGFVFVGVGLFGAPFLFVGVQSIRGKVTARGILENSIGSIGLGLLTVGLGVVAAVYGHVIPAVIGCLAGLGLVAAGVLALVGRTSPTTSERPVAPPSFLCPHCGARVAGFVRGTGKPGETICSSPPAYRRCPGCKRRVATREEIAAALGRGVGFVVFAWLIVFVKALIQVKGNFSSLFSAPSVPEACAIAAITVFFFLVPFLKYWLFNARLDKADPEDRV
jgi:hypothetical protein